MWQGLLTAKDIPNIYIDSFSNDYIDDVFISIAGPITSYAKEKIEKSANEKIKEFTSTAKNVGVQLLSLVAKAGIKASTLGVIKDSDIEEFKEIRNDVAQDASAIAGNFVSERLSSHAKDIEQLELFKKSLSRLAIDLGKSKDKPLVIIIDELDRCKPTYAVEIIEKIKHLFSVKNVVFVLVMHKKQLEEAVKSVYGVNIDACTYLQKFINIETILPKIISGIYVNDIKTYSQKLYDAHELETWTDKGALIENIDFLAEHFNLSLRQLERVYTIITIFYASSAKNHFRVAQLLSFLAVIKVFHPSLFIDLLYEKATYEHVCKVTGLTQNESGQSFLMLWIEFSLMTNEEFKVSAKQDKMDGLSFCIRDCGIKREKLMSMFAQKLNTLTG